MSQPPSHWFHNIAVCGGILASTWTRQYFFFLSTLVQWMNQNMVSYTEAQVRFSLLAYFNCTPTLDAESHPFSLNIYCPLKHVAFLTCILYIYIKTLLLVRHLPKRGESKKVRQLSSPPSARVQTHNHLHTNRRKSSIFHLGTHDQLHV
jgi:hypothetical protein